MQDDYIRCESNRCVYFEGSTYDATFIVLLLYINDMLVASNDINEIKNVKLYMSKCFATKNLGPTKKIQDMNIERDRKYSKLQLSQSFYF